MSTSFVPSIASNKTFSIAGPAAKSVNKLDTLFKQQAKYTTAWFMVSLVFQGVCFLPVPVILAYYFGAPAYLLIVTLTLFFANIIAGMSGAGIRSLIYILAASIVIHVLLLAFYLI